MVNRRALQFRIFLVAVAFGCTSPSRAAVGADTGATPSVSLSASPD
jgi:hypothetical protein